MFHLGWFLGNGTGMYPWYGTWANTYGRDWTKPDFFIDLATSLERGGFDLHIHRGHRHARGHVRRLA